MLFRQGFRSAYQRLQLFGIDPVQTINFLIGMPGYLRDQRAYGGSKNRSSDRWAFANGTRLPQMRDRFSQAGVASGHYFHQDLTVAQEIFRRNPETHIDVGSSISGFVAHIASFRKITVLDVRPMNTQVDNIEFIQQDICALPKDYQAVSDSVSCLHALERFGLGRYGDNIDFDGWRRGLEGLTQLLKPSGILYLGVPTGKIQRVEFNAHRVFALPFLRDALIEIFNIERVAFINDAGDLLKDIDVYSVEAMSSFNAVYGCSVWVLRLKAEEEQ